MNRIYFYTNSHKIFFWCFLVCFALQVSFWKKTEKFHIIPDIVPEAPSQRVLATTSFGDDQFLFRVLAMRLQNAGDVFAGFVSLKKYDYSRIYHWMTLLDTLDDQSKIIPILASYYYSNIKDPEKINHLINYLEEHSIKNPTDNWRFIANAATMARFLSHDLERTLKITHTISNFDTSIKMPMIFRQMYAVTNEVMGRSCVAYNEMKRISKLVENGTFEASPHERAFIKFFLEIRAFKMDNGKFNPKRCKNLS